MTPDVITPGARRRRRWPWWLGAAVLLVAAAAAIYWFTSGKPEEDVSNPEVEFTAPKPVPEEEPPPEKKFGKNFTWGHYGYNEQRTRYLPRARLKGPYRRIWTLGGSKLIEFQPVMAKGTLFFQKNNGEVYAVQARNGHVKWRRRIGGLSASSPAWKNGKLFVVANHGGQGGIAGAGPAKVRAMSAGTGRIKWARRLSSASESSPLVIKARVVVGSQDGTVYAFQSRTGRLLWRFRSGAPVKAAPAYSQGRVYFGDYGGRMTCLSLKTGRVIWRTGTSGRSFGRAGNFYSTPAVAFGRVYVGNTDGKVYSFAASSGRLAWSHSTGSFVYSSPAVAQVPSMRPAVFIGSYTGRFMALDARSGRQLWSYPAGAKISGAPSVIGSTVYFSTLGTKRTYGLNARTGRPVFKLGRGAFNPAISDGVRLYITGYSSIYAFEPKAAYRKRIRAERRERIREARAKRARAKARAKARAQRREESK